MAMVLSAAHAPDIAVFAVAATIILFGALGVVLARNPVHNALSLVLTLFGVAVLFVEQGAHFLAAVQVIVYAGAIVVLFLFVIMLLGVDRTDSVNEGSLKSQRVFAILFSVATFAVLVAIGRDSWDATGAMSQGGSASGDGSNVAKLADSLFTDYLFPFEATSVLLVIAVVGAVFLSRRFGAASASAPLITEGEQSVDESDVDESDATTVESSEGSPS